MKGGEEVVAVQCILFQAFGRIDRPVGIFTSQAYLVTPLTAFSFENPIYGIDIPEIIGVIAFFRLEHKIRN